MWQYTSGIMLRFRFIMHDRHLGPCDVSCDTWRADDSHCRRWSQSRGNTAWDDTWFGRVNADVSVYILLSATSLYTTLKTSTFTGVIADDRWHFRDEPAHELRQIRNRKPNLETIKNYKNERSWFKHLWILQISYFCNASVITMHMDII